MDQARGLLVVDTGEAEVHARLVEERVLAALGLGVESDVHADVHALERQILASGDAVHHQHGAAGDSRDEVLAGVRRLAWPVVGVRRRIVDHEVVLANLLKRAARRAARVRLGCEMEEPSLVSHDAPFLGWPAYGTDTTMARVTRRVRFAPSPTGFLHIGGVRTALFNWLFARNDGGEFLIRIENTDTSREVDQATEQILASLAWLGLDWDGEATFQLDNAPAHASATEVLLSTGAAYEDDGAVRLRVPDEGATGWTDLVKGPVEVRNADVEDFVLVRSDGRATYNFAAPVDDAAAAITHVIRGDDHVSNTPKQLLVLDALGHGRPEFAHVPNVFGTDGKKLSKRHGAVSVEEFRESGYLPAAMMNYLALLGWSLDDKTTVMSRDELVSGFSLERVGTSPATFDYEKLTWLNGVHLRELGPDEYADALLTYLGAQEFTGDEATVRASVPLIHEKIATLGEYPEFCAFLFAQPEPTAEQLGGSAAILTAARERLETTDPFDAEHIEVALRAMCDELELKPRKAFQPVRIAITGSKISPGLFESIELLGDTESLARIKRALAVL